MPFTFAHPAIVLPLLRSKNKWLSPSALVIGSMSPDFEYFLRTEIKSIYSHTLGGIFYFDIPMTIIVSFLFFQIISNPLDNNLNGYLKKIFQLLKIDNYLQYLKNNFGAVVFSAFLGAASHILWDGFTHHDGMFVYKITLLNQQISLGFREVYVYKFLQHLSTLMGFIIIAFYLNNNNNLEQINKSINKPSISYWLTFILVLVLVLGLKFSFGKANIGNLIATSILASFLGLFLASFIHQKNTFL